MCKVSHFIDFLPPVQTKGHPFALTILNSFSVSVVLAIDSFAAFICYQENNPTISRIQRQTLLIIIFKCIEGREVTPQVITPSILKCSSDKLSTEFNEAHSYSEMK